MPDIFPAVVIIPEHRVALRQRVFAWNPDSNAMEEMQLDSLLNFEVPQFPTSQITHSSTVPNSPHTRPVEHPAGCTSRGFTAHLCRSAVALALLDLQPAVSYHSSVADALLGRVHGASASANEWRGASAEPNHQRIAGDPSRTLPQMTGRRGKTEAIYLAIQ